MGETVTPGRSCVEGELGSGADEQGPFPRDDAGSCVGADSSSCKGDFWRREKLVWRVSRRDGGPGEANTGRVYS